jgi:hypothetical protein
MNLRLTLFKENFMLATETETFLSWEDMSPLEQAQCQYWDMYKDAYGVRPRGIDTSAWTLEDFDAEFETLANAIQREELQRKIDQSEAAIRFEAQVDSLIVSGAVSREAAIKWIHEAEGSDGDDEYLCFLLGLSYGYFRKSA